MSGIVQSVKTGHTVATTTIGSGLAGILAIIPDDVAKLATLVGSVLSLVLIVVHIKRYRMDKRSADAELELKELEAQALRRQLEDKEAESPAD